MSRLARRLLEWYARNQRTLPWRGSRDPYAVWVSEIMLQQTRVEAVIPYFLRWMKRFPNVQKLAAASQQEVLKAWEGLGYYSRARNLHRAARVVVDEFGGSLPRRAAELRKLPGIGRYTAGAVASIAFRQDEPALDGNIRRVLARVFNVEEAADSPAGERRLWELALQNLPMGRAGDYNQALMDLGATVCVPANPLCAECPLNGMCEARGLGVQNERPVMRAKGAVPHRLHAAAVIVRRGRVLLSRRHPKGLLGGMWEFPNAATGTFSARSVTAALHKAYGLRIRCGEPLAIVRHRYSHFSVEVRVFRCTMDSGPLPGELRWVPVRDVEQLPMGRVDRQIARQLE